MGHCKSSAMALASGSFMCMGTKVLLLKLICSPENAANSSRMLLIISACSSDPFKISRVSSAYCSVGGGEWESSGWSNYSEWKACCIICCRTSATRMKRYGERGSPWRTPLLYLNDSPVDPLIKTCACPVSKICLIQLIHVSSNPLRCRTKYKQSQLTVSKAFWKSSFRIIVGFFLLIAHWTMSEASIKFSVIDLPLMNADCTGSINSWISPWTRFASTLLISFGRLCSKDIGLKSVMPRGVSFSELKWCKRC